MDKRSRVEDNEIAVEILKVQALVLQQFAEDFAFGYIDASELRRRLNQQVRAILEVSDLLDRDPIQSPQTPRGTGTSEAA